jgi:alpha-glucosidase/alpha-D-xyloside xylohydrolase
MVEPIIRKFTNLRYQLMPYNYTVAREAYDEGLPMMRPLWMYYPTDTIAAKQGNQYLWGRDLLIAPVFEKGVGARDVYLPSGEWYDWWTNEKISGGRSVSSKTNLSTMPIYVRAGAIIPFDPVRQYTGQVVSEPTTLKIYSGSNGSFSLYEDDGISQDYLKNKFAFTQILWDNSKKRLTIQPRSSNNTGEGGKRVFKLELIPGGVTKEIIYSGKKTGIQF